MTAPTPISDLKIHSVLVDAVKPFPGNARVGDVDSIAESLKVNGQFRPIVVRKETREILAGNHTWKAAKKLGWSHINITFVEGITDEQATRIVLADNRFNDLASYNVPDLTALLDSLPDLAGTGFDNYVAVNLEAAFSEEKQAPAAPSSSDYDRLPQTITCPACAHVWEK